MEKVLGFYTVWLFIYFFNVYVTFQAHLIFKRMTVLKIYSVSGADC